MPDEFHGDETLLTSHETHSFPLFVMSAELMIFNAMKLSMEPIETGLRTVPTL